MQSPILPSIIGPCPASEQEISQVAREAATILGLMSRLLDQIGERGGSVDCGHGEREA